CPSTVTDIDGNIYSTVKIGKQCWMQENLKVTHYPNGSPIAYVTDSTAWVKLKNNNTDGAYCYYDNNTNSEYGALYTYAAAIASNWERDKSKGQGICPDGWHLPSDEEWKILKGTVDTKYGVGHNVWDSIGWQGYDAGNFLKSAYGWDNNKNGNNQSGFSGIPGGLRSSNGGFFGIGYLGNWWTSTKFNDGQGWRIRFGTGYKMNRNHYGMSHGYSIRCIKNLQTLKNEGYTETNNNERVACEFPESLYGEWYVNTLWNYSIRKYNGGTRIRTGNKFYYFDSCEQINKDQIIVYAKKDNEEYTFFFHVINNVTMKAKRVKGHKEAWTNEKLSLHTKRLRK
ncbi:MAG: hypothetical protein EOL95_11910, partial [Bacteroidia bacterium]|nr:hypothetical protein [Bacteroidia bacterium]